MPISMPIFSRSCDLLGPVGTRIENSPYTVTQGSDFWKIASHFPNGDWSRQPWWISSKTLQERSAWIPPEFLLLYSLFYLCENSFSVKYMCSGANRPLLHLGKNLKSMFQKKGIKNKRWHQATRGYCDYLSYTEVIWHSSDRFTVIPVHKVFSRSQSNP